ncbi:conserved hypothetical protein [Uncinocarpus reesii 1704]|uniref:chitinase n=1 Tax=Uncinocarpus reesii (strain UAMH 1704) TaxID=336963 RepID=C4JG14_UNCRE|nr:uncharacterized protein UREG_01094 [Uncinocarpus reesii 1704]EEP76245.1 conserved hypothetical protein [Uncinocarpus reesii 1704]
MKPALAYTFVPWLASTVFAQSTPFDPCPDQCSFAGSNPSNWTYLHGESALRRCAETTLFDMAVYTPIDNSDTHITFRACKASKAATTQDINLSVSPFAFGLHQRRSSTSTSGCMRGAKMLRNKSDVHLLRWTGNDGRDQLEDIISAANKLEDLVKSEPDCSSTVIFAHSGKAVVGLYIGEEIHKPTAASIIKQFVDNIERNPSAGKIAVQLCRDSDDDAPNTWILGLYADPEGDITGAQEAVRNWSDAKCLSGFNKKETWKGVEISMRQATDVPQIMALASGLQQSDTMEKRTPGLARDLHRRAPCRAIQVAAGDGCYSLAQRCSISQTQLKDYNKEVSNFCGTLKPNQWVCCSAGDLPDFSPKPNPDGTCATYTIQPADICFSIAQTYYLTTDNIESLNKNTWGWTGCKNLQVGQRICLSSGDPPMPAPIPNAVCGPQVPGTARPTDGTKLQDLNPCPLNVCCNVWGQCGLTRDFCVESPADTGAPGTSKPGANGCISNCGMDVVNNEEPPESFSRVAYFEAWNKDRICLHMDVTDIDTDHFTHIHFAFADLTPEFDVDITRVKDQFMKLKGMTGIKRILSFGGWTFSTERPTYTIFREGVTPENRLKFVTNVVNFIKDHDLEGVDFDWEYPAAPSLPGDIPPGTIEEGKNYLEFIKMVKQRLPDKSVSIAAPASYWYLKGFPIKEIGETVDYIIYMTYDLHGQWDYGNKWTSEGCPEGNCLRSHINITETQSALSMITKAGVPANKVFCGITSYGRSFKMAEEGCTGPTCKFTGSALVSDAAPGVCTNTSGYISSAEIRELIKFGEDFEETGIKTKGFFDDESHSDILVYNDLEWVGWMSDETKTVRSALYKFLNFGGTSDWAVDLDRYGGTGVPPEDEESHYEPCGEADLDGGLEALERVAGTSPRRCVNRWTVELLKKKLVDLMAKYDEVNDGYDSKFASYSRYMKVSGEYQFLTFVDWETGPGQAFFDCKFEGDGNTYNGPCPVPVHLHKKLSTDFTLEYTLKDKAGFLEAVVNETGIDSDVVEFVNTEHIVPCDYPTDCLPTTLEIMGGPRLMRDWEPPNPKDIIVGAFKNLPTLQTELIIGALQIGTDHWEGDEQDIVQVLSMPVFMMVQAIDAMEETKEIAEEIEEQKKKELFSLLIAALLFFIPFAGEFLAVAAGLARLARLIRIAGEVGDAALTLKDIVENKELAPLAILDLLAGGKLRGPKSYRDAADVRRSMSAKDLSKMGDVFKMHDDLLQNILTKSCSRT